MFLRRLVAANLLALHSERDGRQLSELGASSLLWPTADFEPVNCAEISMENQRVAGLPAHALNVSVPNVYISGRPVAGGHTDAGLMR
jgi:hypothetical protein